jgi:N-acetylglucosaminyldiphosphoundecaprenol N-acetyl-beta-D-mannosaminyltransferase
MSVDRVNILGVGVSAVNMKLALEVIAGWIAARAARYVCVANVHSIVSCHNDSELRAIHNRAGMVTPDGMPLVWLSRRAGYRHVERVYGPDLLLALCEYGLPRGYRHFFSAAAMAWRSAWRRVYRRAFRPCKWQARTRRHSVRSALLKMTR